MVLIRYTGDGPNRRCDGHCYNGRHDKCKCICNGKNHGKGLKIAVENVRDMQSTFLENMGLAKGKLDLYVPDAVEAK